MKETFLKYTMDAISTCTLGIEANALNNPHAEVKQKIQNTFEFSYKKGFKGFLMFFEPQIYKFFKMTFLESETANFFRNTFWETAKYR